MVQQRFKPVGRIVVRHIGDDALLVPVSGPASGGRVYPVNETAECVWNCLAGGGTIDKAVEMLSARYAVTPAEARTDCEACANALLAEGLIAKGGA